MKKLFFLSLLLFCSCMKIERIDKNKLIAPALSQKGDGYIFVENVHHYSSAKDVVLKSADEVKFFLEARKDDLEEVQLVFNNEKYEMETLAVIGEREYYYADVPAIDGEYYFELTDRKKIVNFGVDGSEEKFLFELAKYNEKIGKEIYPEWAAGLVWYKIFVDSFRNGNKENDPRYNELGKENFIPWAENEESSLGEFKLSRWNSNFSFEEEWGSKINSNDWDKITAKRFGGDLRGIEEKLNYLEELGIDILELTPVFYSNSNNKFDIIDYRHVSPDFGVIKQTDEFSIYSESNKTYLEEGISEIEALEFYQNEKNGFDETLEIDTWKWSESDLLFAELIKKANEKNIRVIADIDFRGVSEDFIFFRDVLINGPESTYREWFVFSDWNEVTEYSELNIDDWNPYVEYTGDSDYHVVDIDDKKYRRKWIKIENKLSEEKKAEILNWNMQNIAYEKINKKKIRLNLNSESLREYLFSSAKKWLEGFSGDGSDSLSGYKVYINNYDSEFYDMFKFEMLSFDSDKLIIRDTIENYEYVDKIIKVLVDTEENIKISLDEFKENIKMLNASYYNPTKKVAQYPLDGIYTDRIYSQLINNNREFDKLNKTVYGNNYMEIRPNLLNKGAVNKLKQIIALQIFSSTNPYIYYGTEVGMWGGDVPYNRKPMLWQEEFPYDEESDDINKYQEVKNKLSGKVVFDEVQEKIYYTAELNNDILDWYKQLLQIYKENKIYFTDSKLEFPSVIEKENEVTDILVLKYKLNNEDELFIIINPTTKSRTIDLEVESRDNYIEILSEEELTVIERKIQIKLDSNGIAIIKK